MTKGKLEAHILRENKTDWKKKRSRNLKRRHSAGERLDARDRSRDRGARDKSREWSRERDTRNRLRERSRERGDFMKNEHATQSYKSVKIRLLYTKADAAHRHWHHRTTRHSKSVQVHPHDHRNIHAIRGALPDKGCLSWRRHGRTIEPVMPLRNATRDHDGLWNPAHEQDLGRICG